MQNNKKSKGFLNFVKDKGYYIVLLLCAVAVGVSGYFLLSGRSEEPQEDVKISASTPSTATEKTPSSGATTPMRNAVALQEDEPTEGSEPSESAKTASKMNITMPVDGEPINAYAVDFLAYNETTRDWRTHDGIDLAAALGQDVVAAADGSVYTIYEDESLGMTVVLRHTGGYTTHYSNLEKDVSVQVGQNVTVGTVLGKVGQTAGTEIAAEPHLHFSVYRDNVPVDPTEFMKLS